MEVEAETEADVVLKQENDAYDERSEEKEEGREVSSPPRLPPLAHPHGDYSGDAYKDLGDGVVLLALRAD